MVVTSAATSRHSSSRSSRERRRAHPAQQHQRQRRVARIDPPQRAPAPLPALFRHMPLQSGSDRVLRAMHRGYRRAQYLRVVSALRDKDPATEFTTDIMVGFPARPTTTTRPRCHSSMRWVPSPAMSSLVTASRDSGIRYRCAGRRCDRSAAQRRGAPRHPARRRRAPMRAPVDGPRGGLGPRRRRRCPRTHGGYHEVVVDRRTRVRSGGLDLVRAETVEGDRLRATLLRS